jgi:hypothetical protein
MLRSIEQYEPDIQNFNCAPRYLEVMSSTSKPQRALACAFALCSVATLILLSAHPASPQHTIADILQAEVRDQARDGVVHGGFIVISALLIVCMAELARLLGSARALVTTGLVAFCVGAGALMMSMTLDGLVVPAIAKRCLSDGTAQSLTSATTLLLFCGICIKVLMPMGLLFESAAMLSYSLAAFARKWSWVGVYGVAAGIGILSCLLLLPGPGPHLLIGAIVVLAAWYLGIAGALWRH